MRVALQETRVRQEDAMRRRAKATATSSRRAPAKTVRRAAINGAADPAWAWDERRWRGAVNRVRAGRSLKPARWKNGARVCVALSFDSDHETGTLREGSTSPGRLAQGEYGARAGVPRILDLLRRHDLRASFFVPGVIAQLHAEEQRRVVAEGHEIGMHGWIHEGTSELTEGVERDLMRRAFDTLAKIAGRPPVGIRVPSWDFSATTLPLIRELGLLYDSSLMADDEPYELLDDGEPTGIVELPVEWIKDDAPYLNMNRATAIRPYTPPSAVLEIFRGEFDGAVAEGGLFLLTMHPHIIGHRSRLALLETLIRHMKDVPGVWFATHEEVARYCLAPE
jgi:peptidoglycan/xylan/chitin deacetylase (PgdA/CDA1 family)